RHTGLPFLPRSRRTARHCLLPGRMQYTPTVCNPPTSWEPTLRKEAMATAVDVVRRFRRLRALVIGDAMLDSYLEGTAARLCSEGPVPVVQKTSEQHAPAGAANTAANLRALGAHVAFVGRVGRAAPGP